MASLFDTRLGLGLATAAAMAVGAGAVLWLQGPGTTHQSETASAKTASAWDGPIGPGALPRGMPMDLAAASTGGQPLVDADGRLAIDARLHALFDSYLLQSRGTPASAPAPAFARDARARELRTWLGSQLKPPALGQANELVDAYVRYLQAEDELRARERFTRPDPAGLTDAQVDQMAAWQQTRTQLRERMLGTMVAQAWFGADDADCAGAFADWRKQHEPLDAPDVDSNELRARRLHGARLEETRNEHALSCAGRLMGTLAQQ
jgi:hypothetical protein